MDTKNAVEVIKDKSAEIYTPGPMEMAQSFLSSGGDLTNLERMMELQEKYDALQAKKAFVLAMAEFKKEPIKIAKDKKNKQYGSKYSSIGATVNPCLSRMGECGLSHKWEFVQDDPKTMTGTCTVIHKDGHSDSVSMVAPVDTSGNKNPIQQIKSTRTYIKIETFTSLMGLTSSEDLDDDGNSAGKPVQCITEKQCVEIREMIESIDGLTEEAFLKWAKKESIEAILENDLERVKIALKARSGAV